MRIHGDKIEFPDGTEQFTASTGSGDVVATPPVAFAMSNPTPSGSQSIPQNTETLVEFDTSTIDTDSGVDLDNNVYIAQQDGLMNVSAKISPAVTDANDLQVGVLYLKLDGKTVESSYFNTFTNFVNANTLNLNTIIEVKKGQEISVYAKLIQSDPSTNQTRVIKDYSSLSGHMVSSITEGEVKEKEAVVLEARLSADQSLTNETWERIDFDQAITDTNNAFNNSQFKPSVAGWYQINCSIGQGANSQQMVSAIYKNGEMYSLGDLVKVADPSAVNITSGSHSNLVYLNGDNDFVEIWGYLVNALFNLVSSDSVRTYFNAHLITGQSTGGGSGEASEPTDILPVLYSGLVNEAGVVLDGSGFSSTNTATGSYDITFDTPLPNNKYVVQVTPASTLSKHRGTVSYLTKEGFKVKTGTVNSVGAPIDSNTSFTFIVTGTETIAVGGGSGGGSYTPEPLFWENKTDERAFDTVYTNDTDVPKHVYLAIHSPNDGANHINVMIDNNIWASIGGGATGGGRTLYLDGSYLIPAGSTYEFKAVGAPLLTKWNEARMPMAVGAGKPVAFRGELSADQSIPNRVLTKINFNTASIDTDNAFEDGKFKPSVAGWYQVNGSASQQCNPISTNINANIYKNGTRWSQGSTVEGTKSYVSHVSDVIYLNGTTDYIELWAHITSSGTCGIEARAEATYLSAVLVSGGSGGIVEAPTDGKQYARQDETWTEVAPKAGSILQVVQGRTKTQVTTSSAGYVDIGLEATITPSSTSSKILVMCNVAGVFFDATADAFAKMMLLRDGTGVTEDPLAPYLAYPYLYHGTATTRASATAINYLDFPSRTTPTTYKIQSANSGGGTVNFQRDGQVYSTIILMEVAG